MNTIGLVLLSSLVTAEEVARWALAVRGQLRNHVAPAWRIVAPVLTLYESLEDVPEDVPLISIFDDSDHSMALGYHTEAPDGRRYARVFVNDSRLEGSEPSSVLSHEAIELALNPDVNRWAENANVSGELWAMEGCDACQAQSYEYRGVQVSDFLLPAFFDAVSPPDARVDWLGVLPAPFTLATGGYSVVRSGSLAYPVMRQAAPRELPASKLHPAARTQRILRARADGEVYSAEEAHHLAEACRSPRPGDS